MVCKDHEVHTVDVAPERLWAALNDGHNLLPKVCPQYIKSIELHGDGSPGNTTRTIHYGPAAAAATGSSYVKEKLVAIDEASKTVTTEFVEGGTIGKHFQSMKLTTTLKPGKDANTTEVSYLLEYTPIGDATPEELKKGSHALLKTTVDHLRADPQAYA